MRLKLAFQSEYSASLIENLTDVLLCPMPKRYAARFNPSILTTC